MFAIFTTGTLSYFNPEISHWMKPELANQPIINNQLALINRSVALLQQKAPDAPRWQVSLPSARQQHFRLAWQDDLENRKSRTRISLLADDFSQVSARETDGGNFFRQFHYTLELREFGGRYLVGVAAMMMLVALFSGIFTHRRFFKDFFTLRWKNLSKGLTDSHALIGIITLPFFFVLCFSGLLFYLSLYMPWSANTQFEKGYQQLNQHVSTSLPKVSASNTTVKVITDFSYMVTQVKKQWPEQNSIARLTYNLPTDPNGQIVFYRTKQFSLSGKREVLSFNTKGELMPAMATERLPRQIKRIFIGLHEAQFATPLLRWILFFMGAACSFLIASGLILWLHKRQKKAKPHLGHAIVERLNITGIGGLLLAIASYFCANRLLPVTLGDRADAEVIVFLITWFIVLCLSLFIRPIKLWVALLAMTGASLCLLPFLDFFVNHHWLIQAIEHRNWLYLGADISFVISGAVLLVIMQYVRKRTGATISIKKPVLQWVGRYAN